ncbi:hypothetical protein TUBRATIS_006090 [Tubulinosema ratisbonensis]|uniref:Uncharacterized protein n=1 Tax=Tubulinosema ratisbonensis TaxID=291195 RepID=A0A437ANW9_9MICR|nr:hypothetical protein TUBRATIS_006090 [Tubulinosema ratisbonensis]
MNSKEIKFSLNFKLPKIIHLKKRKDFLFTKQQLENVFKKPFKKHKILKLNNEKRKLRFTMKNINLSVDFKIPKVLIQKKNRKNILNFLPKIIYFHQIIDEYFYEKLKYFKKQKIKHKFTVNLPKKVPLKNINSFDLDSYNKTEISLPQLFLILNINNMNGYEREFLHLKELYSTKEIFHEGDWLIIINNKISITKKIKTNYPKNMHKLNEHKINKENLVEKIRKIISF